MKKFLLIPIFITLTGCASWADKLIGAYNLAPYDNYEYSLVNKVRTMAEKAEDTCANKQQTEANIDSIFWVAKEYNNFAQHIPDNTDSFKMSTELFTLVKSTKEHYINNKEVGVVFCRLKMKQIYSNAETIQKAIGARPR